MKIEELKNLDAAERIRAMETLWDAMLRESEDIEAPAWHDEVLKARKARIDQGEAKFITLDELKALRRK